MDLYKVLCICLMVVYIDVLVGLLTVGMGIVSDTFAWSWDPFLPTGSPFPALLWGFAPGLTVTCYSIFSCHPFEACSFLKKKENNIDFWKIGSWVEGVWEK